MHDQLRTTIRDHLATRDRARRGRLFRPERAELADDALTQAIIKAAEEHHGRYAAVLNADLAATRADHARPRAAYTELGTQRDKLRDRLEHANRITDALRDELTDARQQQAQLLATDADNDRLHKQLTETETALNELRPRYAAAAGLARDILSRFAKGSDGHRARVGQVQVAKWETALKELEETAGD